MRETVQATIILKSVFNSVICLKQTNVSHISVNFRSMSNIDSEILTMDKLIEKTQNPIHKVTASPCSQQHSGEFSSESLHLLPVCQTQGSDGKKNKSMALLLRCTVAEKYTSAFYQAYLCLLIPTLL